MPTADDDSGSDREDELPQVVVLKSGDLTAEDVKKIKEEIRGGEAQKGETTRQNREGLWIFLDIGNGAVQLNVLITPRLINIR